MLETHFITSPDQLADPKQAMGLCVQVSQSISSYNKDHPGEMLNKTPEEILTQFLAGLSVFIIHQNGGDPEFIFHATAYELAKIGRYQILEGGSVITHSDYRGQGFGKAGSDRLAYVIENQSQSDVLWLATNKQTNAFMAMTHGARMVQADFYQFPFLTYLTCTCDHCSERFGHSCPYRRQSNQTINVSQNGSIPCTLIVSDLQKAIDFEKTCHRLAKESRLPFPDTGIISIASMKLIGDIFNKIS